MLTEEGRKKDLEATKNALEEHVKGLYREVQFFAALLKSPDLPLDKMIGELRKIVQLEDFFKDLEYVTNELRKIQLADK